MRGDKPSLEGRGPFMHASPLAFSAMLYYFISMSSNIHHGHHHHHAHHATAGRLTWSLMRLSALSRLGLAALAILPVWAGILLVTGI
jgi:hypothetical protein